MMGDYSPYQIAVMELEYKQRRGDRYGWHRAELDRMRGQGRMRHAVAAGMDWARRGRAPRASGVEHGEIETTAAGA